MSRSIVGPSERPTWMNKVLAKVGPDAGDQAFAVGGGLDATEVALLSGAGAATGSIGASIAIVQNLLGLMGLDIANLAAALSANSDSIDQVKRWLGPSSGTMPDGYYDRLTESIYRYVEGTLKALAGGEG